MVFLFFSPMVLTFNYILQESASIQRVAAKADQYSRTDGWVQFDEAERKNFMERNATWHMMQLTCPTFINTTQCYPNNSNYISSSATASMATTTSTTVTTRLMDPKLIKRTHDLSLFISPFHLTSNSSRINNSTHTQHEESDQTLQLFPIRNEGDNGGCDAVDHSIINQHKETEISSSAMNAPNQFIEFLPLKN